MHPHAMESIMFASMSALPTEALEEWNLESMMDRRTDDGTCECGRAIRYEFHIENEINHATLILGSTCIRDIGVNIDFEMFVFEYMAGKRILIPIWVVDKAAEYHLISEVDAYWLYRLGNDRSQRPCRVYLTKERTQKVELFEHRQSIMHEVFWAMTHKQYRRLIPKGE